MASPFYAFLANFDWLVWGVALIVGLPLLVITLGEISQGLNKWGFGQWKKLLDLVRNSCLFLLFLMILLRMVVGLPASHLAVKIVDTFFWITVLNASLVLFNTIIFETGASEWQAKAPRLLTDLGRMFLVAVGGAFIISHVWEVDLNGLLAALGVGSIVIGLAMQDTLSNLFGGVMLVAVRQFNVGDWIQVGDVDGQVRSISWRAVTVATIEGDIVDIPNSQIYSQRLRVYGGDKGRLRITIEIRFRNSYPPEPVKDILIETALATVGVLEQPKPRVWVKGAEEATFLYEVSFWIEDYRLRDTARSEFLSNLWYVARRHGMRLPGGLVEDEAVGDEGGVVPDRLDSSFDGNIGHSPSARDVSIGARLFELGTFQRPIEALESLAADARIERYRKGEVVMRPGVRGDAAFVVLSGMAHATGALGDKTIVMCAFGPGDLILFKAFLRGGGSPFMVSGSTDLELIRLPLTALENALARDVHLAQKVEQLLTLREESTSQGLGGTDPNLINGAGQDADRVQLLRDLFRH